MILITRREKPTGHKRTNEGNKKTDKKKEKRNIIICRTDKTGKLSAMSKEKYIESVREHTRKDKITTREECINEELNGHTRQLLKITRAGSDWKQENRFRSMMINKGAAEPPMYCK